MAALLPPPGTVCCLLCRGMVAYRNLDTARFAAHMNYEHGAYFDMEFLLAACLMDEEERKAVRNVMELKHRQQQEKGREGDERRGRGEKRPLEGGEQERAVHSVQRGATLAVARPGHISHLHLPAPCVSSTADSRVRAAVGHGGRSRRATRVCT